VITETDLTIDELIARWRSGVSKGTLANWRSKGLGPPWKRPTRRLILYPLAGVIAYEAQRTEDGRWWKPSKESHADDPFA
jgi:hypothetical protein